MNYVKINNVMNFIPKSLREIQKDDDQWLSWALQSLRTVNTHELYTKDFILLEIDNHKCKLPEGLKKIISLKVLTDIPTDAQIASLNKCITIKPRDTNSSGTTPDPEITLTNSENSQIHYFDDFCGLYVQLFQESEYYKKAMKPLRYRGVSKRNYFTSECYKQVTQCRDCYTGFSITPDNCLLLDCKKGLICIEYECEVKDNDGNFLIPKTPIQLWNAMAHYAIAHHWLNRTGNKEQNSVQMYEKHMFISSNFMREAKGIFRMQNIDFKLLSAITFKDTDIIKIPSVWSYKTIESNNGIKISHGSY